MWITVLPILFFLPALVLAISAPTYDLLAWHSQLSDVAYCVQTVRGPTQLRTPFKCGKQCREPQMQDMQLIHAFVHSPARPALTGYLAVDHASHTKYVVFRGTNSIEDTVLDLSFGQQPSVSPGFLQGACPECQVQGGILAAYETLWEENSGPLSDFLHSQYPNYTLSVTGHSLGGVAAALLATHAKLEGLDPTLVTFGQPRYANLAYAQLVDSLFFPLNGSDGGSNLGPLDESPRRRMFRVTHWNDVFVSQPELGGFHHSLGEVYISYPWVSPPRRTVRYCDGAQSEYCHRGDYNPLERANFLKNHLAYFGWIGYCPYL
uniref:triacylglycerol lipase n=1 Tax=Yarrowia alimentaria TaxID=479092 RepID=A0A078BRU2_9ASCO|nr:lipase [Yarrowia alimentaria]